MALMTVTLAAMLVVTSAGYYGPRTTPVGYAAFPAAPFFAYRSVPTFRTSTGPFGYRTMPVGIRFRHMNSLRTSINPEESFAYSMNGNSDVRMNNDAYATSTSATSLPAAYNAMSSITVAPSAGSYSASRSAVVTANGAACSSAATPEVVASPNTAVSRVATAQAIPTAAVGPVRYTDASDDGISTRVETTNGYGNLKQAASYSNTNTNINTNSNTAVSIVRNPDVEVNNNAFTQSFQSTFTTPFGNFIAGSGGSTAQRSSQVLFSGVGARYTW